MAEKKDQQSHFPELSQAQQRVLGADGIIIGFILGLAMIIWAWPFGPLDQLDLLHPSHGPFKLTATVETLLVALYLTMVVAFCGLKMPTFFAQNPRASTFALVLFAGHISLFFDSFAVILLLASGITFLKLEGTNDHLNSFAVKTFATFAALTVGGGFYLGELWGLPYYITSGMNNPLAGFPLLLVLTPYNILLAYLAARYFPVKMKSYGFDKQQGMATFEFSVALLLIIWTHNPFFCLGVLFFYSALRFRTVQLIKDTAHEFTDGAQNALGLILLAVIIQSMTSIAPIIQEYLQGFGLFVGAAISSPFAGAMAAAPANLHDFYMNLTLIMLGAPVFVFSSLVAIVVFKHRLDTSDMPPFLQKLSKMFGAKGGYWNEGIAYTFFIIPMNLGLAILMFLANHYGLFVWGAGLLGFTELPASTGYGH